MKNKKERKKRIPSNLKGRALHWPNSCLDMTDDIIRFSWQMFWQGSKEGNCFPKAGY